MKLLAFGLTVLAIGLGLVVFTYLDPTTPFIGGVLCTLLGALHVMFPGAGSSKSLDPDALTLGRIVGDDRIR